MNLPQPDDIGFIKQFAEWLLGGVLALAGLIFKGIKADLDTKASQSQVKVIHEGLEQRKGIEAKLFDRIQEESDKTTVQFTQITSQMHKSHVELLNAIHEVKRK